MRKEKSVLIFCADEFFASQMRFRLDVWGFRVASAATSEEAHDAYVARYFDLVLIVPDKTGSAELIDQMQKLQDVAGGTLRIMDVHAALTPADAELSRRISTSGPMMRQEIRFAIAESSGPRTVR